MRGKRDGGKGGFWWDPFAAAGHEKQLLTWLPTWSQKELNVAISAVKAMTRTDNDAFSAPQQLCGGTSLVDAVDQVFKELPEGVDRMFIITDGEDTSSKAKQIWKMGSDGSNMLIDFDHSDAKQLNKMVAEHFACLNVELCVCGVGTEVKEFINALEHHDRGRFITAHVLSPTEPNTFWLADQTPRGPCDSPLLIAGVRCLLIYTYTHINITPQMA